MKGHFYTWYAHFMLLLKYKRQMCQGFLEGESLEWLMQLRNRWQLLLYLKMNIYISTLDLPILCSFVAAEVAKCVRAFQWATHLTKAVRKQMTITALPYNERTFLHLICPLHALLLQCKSSLSSGRLTWVTKAISKQMSYCSTLKWKDISTHNLPLFRASSKSRFGQVVLLTTCLTGQVKIQPWEMICLFPVCILVMH